MPMPMPMPVPPSAPPSAWIMRFAGRLQPGAQVLDLACGFGRHARALAALGCEVDAVDRDPQCAAALQGIAGVRFRCLELESDQWPIQPDRYDAIVVANYLHRPRLAELARSLREGGRLVYETFAAGQETIGRPGNPDYLLQPFELARVFAPLLHVLAFEDGLFNGERRARVQRLCGIRTDASRLDRLALPRDV
jgi:SAM-dependent methyltransferase